MADCVHNEPLAKKQKREDDNEWSRALLDAAEMLLKTAETAAQKTAETAAAKEAAKKKRAKRIAQWNGRLTVLTEKHTAVNAEILEAQAQYEKLQQSVKARKAHIERLRRRKGELERLQRRRSKLERLQRRRR